MFYSNSASNNFRNVQWHKFWGSTWGPGKISWKSWPLAPLHRQCPNQNKSHFSQALVQAVLPINGC